ncbi:MAG: histidine kinase [Clostridiaceae bacterium]|nr:histidine kinase [Clostridiaceae bacterium]
MTELLDNITQSAAMLIAFIAAGVLYYRTHRQPFYLLACFFGCFMLGTFHWTLYVLLFNSSPQVFYVSELAWIASYLFLLTLEYVLAAEAEKKFRHPAMLLVPIFCIPQLILYLSRGEIFGNLLMVGLTMAVAYFAIRGFFYARSQNGEARKMQYFYGAVLVIIFLEYCLWTSSCFWNSDTMSNPYFWFDFLLSAALLALIPATKKAVLK